MRPVLTLPAVLALALPAPAQDLTEAEAVILPRIIDHVCVDIVPDRPGCETAILLTSTSNELAADLIVQTDRRGSEDPSAPGVETSALGRAVAFDGPAFGQSPGSRRKARRSGSIPNRRASGAPRGSRC